MYDLFDEELIKSQMKDITFKFGQEEELGILEFLDSYVVDKNDLNNLLNYKININFNDIQDIKSIEYRKRLFDKDLNSFKQNNEPEPPAFDNLAFCKEDILDFTHYLYNNFYTKEIADTFNRYYDKKEGSIVFKDKIRAFSVYIKSVDHAYLILQNNNSIFDLTEASHEYAHIICEATRRRDYYEFPFVETLPFLSELIATDHADEYFVELDKKDTIGYRRWCFDNILETVKGYPNNGITKLEYYSYSLSYLLAIELYYEYIKDREKCFYKFFKILNESNKNYKKVLKNYNISLNEHIGDFVKSIS